MRFDKNVLLGSIGLLLGVGIGFAILSFVTNTFKLPGFSSGETVGVAIGSPAPELALQNLTGETVRLRELSGQTVVINFWATWCGPCRTEMPILEEVALESGSKVTILAVNYAEPVSDVQDFAEELGLTLPILVDPGGEVTDRYQVQAFPTTIFVDEQGIIQAVHIGSISKTQLTGYLQQIETEK